MAEVLLKHVVGDRIFVDSCGLKLQAGEVGARLDPLVEEVLAEFGCDLDGHRPKTFDDLDPDSFDLVVSLTPESQHRAVELTRGRAVVIEYWPVYDPTLAEGSRETRLAAYRDVRDALFAQISARFGPSGGGSAAGSGLALRVRPDRP
jgi:protein-tyrosine-phosphatase